MKQRVLTACGLVSALVLVLFMRQYTPYIVDLFILGISIGCAYEMSKLLSRNGKYNNIVMVCLFPIASYAMLLLSIYFQHSLVLLFILQLSLMVLMLGLTMVLSMIFAKKSDNEIKTRKLKISIDKFSVYKGVYSLMAFVYPSFLLLFLFLVNRLESFSYIFTANSHFVLFALILTFVIPIIVDTFAMLTGMLFGGKKLAPNISPKKTISGAIGGCIWCIIVCALMYIIFDATQVYSAVFNELGLEFWHFMILGLVSSIVCQAGDLFESWIKRKANVKDSGNVFPGHGGFLDRLDSHIGNALVMFVFCLIVLL